MAVQRSPKYPAFGLDAAVQYIRQVYDKERRAAVPPEVVGKALGYNSPSGKLSGPALTKIASLRQYGLFDRVQGKLRVSDHALDFILHNTSDAAYHEAAKRAALSPPLFAELLREYAGASDEALRAHLVKGNFSEEAAVKIIRAFRDTISFAKLDSESYNGGEGDAEGDKDQDGSREEKPPKPPHRNQREQEARSVAYSWPLGGGNKVDLGFTSEPTQAQLDVMLAQLKIMREVAPTEPPSEAEIEGDQ